MCNYEVWTIAVPQNKPEIQEKFFTFMNDKDFSGLMVGAVGLQIDDENALKRVLESYVAAACEKGGFSINV